jgi:hypothetical protein
VISTYFSCFQHSPQALTAAHPLQTENQISHVTPEQRVIEIWREAEWDILLSPDRHRQILSLISGRGSNPCLPSVLCPYPRHPHLASLCSLKSAPSPFDI